MPNNFINKTIFKIDDFLVNIKEIQNILSLSLTLTLTFPMHNSHMQENCENQMQLFFNKSKIDLVLKDLNRFTHLNL